MGRITGRNSLMHIHKHPHTLLWAAILVKTLHWLPFIVNSLTLTRTSQRMFCDIRFSLWSPWGMVILTRSVYSSCVHTHIHKPSLSSKWSNSFLANPLQSQSPEHTPLLALFSCISVSRHHSQTFYVWVSVCVWEREKYNPWESPSLWEVISCLAISP